MITIQTIHKDKEEVTYRINRAIEEAKTYKGKGKWDVLSYEDYSNPKKEFRFYKVEREVKRYILSGAVNRSIWWKRSEALSEIIDKCFQYIHNKFIVVNHLEPTEVSLYNDSFLLWAVRYTIENFEDIDADSPIDRHESGVINLNLHLYDYEWAVMYKEEFNDRYAIIKRQ